MREMQWGTWYVWTLPQDVSPGVFTKSMSDQEIWRLGHDHGDGEKIYVLPGWPKKWDVSFKLHAPKNTTLEGVYRAGKLEQMKVTPESRRQDVVVSPLQSR